MNERIIGNSLAVLYVLQLPLLVGLCIYNAKTVKKKGRPAAPFVWLTIGLSVATIVGSTLLWVLLHWPFGNSGYTEGFLTVFLALCGSAASVLAAKRALNADDKREKILSYSLRTEHFTNGQSFRQADFDSWILASRKAARVALPCYLGAILAGGALSLFFSNAVGGVFGSVIALLCVFAGLLVGGSLIKRVGREATYYATRVLHISKQDIAAARERMKRGDVAWTTPDAMESSTQGGN